tara:strand:+ start:1680 stop:2132 length:453 start_codon:yes stop_codon:yes gene_type:complete
MTAFDTAWDLLKMPFHGTGSRNAKQIMREGLRPMPHPWFMNNPDYPNRVSFASKEPTYAGEFAQIRSDKGGPAIIHISDEMPTIMNEEGADAVVYGETIPPEMMEIVYQGREILPEEDEDDYQDWVQNDIREWLLARNANPNVWERGDDE